MKKDIVVIVVALVLALVVRYWLLPVLGYSVASVEGQSMEPTLRSGDLLLLRRDLNPEVGDIVVYEKSPGILIVHRILKVVEDGEIITRGDNNGYPDPIFPSGKIVGKVTLVIPRFRIIQKYSIFLSVFLLAVIILEISHQKQRRRG